MFSVVAYSDDDLRRDKEKKMNIKVDYIRKSKYARPQKQMGTVKGVVVHWTASPRATAQNIRDYFNKTKRYGSTQYAIGIKGEIVQIMPEQEIAYHVGARAYNQDTLDFAEIGGNPNKNMIGIELCHQDWSGKFTDETLDSAVELCIDILTRYDLTFADVWRHYDVTYKSCPRYFVKNEDAYNQFITRIEKAMNV